MYKKPRGRFQGPYCGGWGSRCIKELSRPARAPHPYRPLEGTIKKSTAPYKVHNIRPPPVHKTNIKEDKNNVLS
jgi:hypothetical protein